MPTTLAEQQLIQVGEPIVIESPSDIHPHMVVFEDEGETGYFYAVARTEESCDILDALHIYSVEGVTDRHLPSEVKIYWSADGLKAALFINDYAHAVFDFENRRGYCRDDFPEPNHDWTRHSHTWDDRALHDFRDVSN